jgi:protocatechuate 3,4-dioxygenase beta subunit
MKRIQRWLLIPGVALVCHLQAADLGTLSQYTGVVVDEQGRPVAGAIVDSYQYHSSSGPLANLPRDPELIGHAVADGRGAFAIPASPGTMLAVVTKAGLAPAWKTWSAAIADSSDPLVLTAPTTLSGVVVDENGQPVPGAEVWVSEASVGDEQARTTQQNTLSGQPARERFSARTAADGSFHIENFPADGHAALAVSKPSKAQYPIGNSYVGLRDFRSGQKDIELLLGPAGSVEGKAMVQETGQPLAGVEVWLQSTTGISASSPPVQSGADGVFRIPDLRPDSYNLMAIVPGRPVPDWAVEWTAGPVTVAANTTTGGVLIRASKGVLVEVSVVATNNPKPVANAEVSSGRSIAYTGSNGVVVLRSTPGKVWLSISGKGWLPLQSTVETEPGRTNRVQVELVPSPRITGVVRDPSGLPAAGVLVSFHPGQYPGACFYAEARTDENGRYELSLQRDLVGFWEGPISVTNFILAQSFERNLAAIQEFDAIPTDLDLTLQPGITLSGFVKDVDGAPVSGATVELRILSGHSITRVAERPTRVDAQGFFSIPALPQGREYSMFNGITAKGYGTAYGRLEARDSRTNRYEFPAFVLKRADRRLAGQVLGPDNEPIAGAIVHFSGRGQPEWPTARSDRKGHFVFDAVCEGEVQLHAYWNGPPGSQIFMTSGQGTGIKTQAGDTNVVVPVRDPNVFAGAGAQLTIRGTVYDPAGAPDPGVVLTMWRSANPFWNFSSDANGKFLVRWQHGSAPGVALNIKSSLVARDVGRNLVATRDVDETETNLDLHLQPGLTLSGSLQDEGGRPVTNARVSLHMWLNHAGAELTSTTADAHGSFSFTALPPEGDFALNVSADEYGSARVEVSSERATSRKLELPPIMLKSAYLQLSGKVVGPDDEPLPGIWVGISGVGQPGGNAQTDAEGRFVFKHVAAGPVRVSTSRDGVNGGQPTTVSSQAQGGDTNVVLKLNAR